MSNIEHINELDTLNTGRNKINLFAIDPANRAEINSIDAKSVANQANQTSQSAEAIAINTDDRLDNIIAGEMQDAEVIDARRPFGGETYATLGERLDSEKTEVTTQLAQTDKEAKEYTDSSLSTLYKGKKGRKPLVSFIVDDGSISDYNKLKPIFKEKNVQAGLAIVTSWAGSSSSYMNWEQIKEMSDDGHEILSHSHSHKNMTELSDSELKFEFEESKKILREKGYLANGFVYPFNATSVASRNEIVKHYVRGYAKSGSNQNQEGVNTPIFRNYEIARNALGSYFDGGDNTDTLGYYKSLVDNAKSTSNLLVFVLHSQPMGESELGDLENTIDYIRLQGIPIVPPSEAFDIYGNIIEYPNRFVMDSNGEVDGTIVRIEKDTINTKSVSDDYLRFRNNKITYSTTTDAFANSEGFPSNKRGNLITDRIGGTYEYTKQCYEVSPIFSSLNRKELFERFVKSDGTWTDFERHSSGGREFDKTTSSFTLNPKETQDITIPDVDGVHFSDVVSIQPYNDTFIKTGVLFQLLSWTNGQLKIRMSNITDSSIVLDNIRWRINVKYIR